MRDLVLPPEFAFGTHPAFEGVRSDPPDAWRSDCRVTFAVSVIIIIIGAQHAIELPPKTLRQSGIALRQGRSGLDHVHVMSRLAATRGEHRTYGELDDDDAD